MNVIPEKSSNHRKRIVFVTGDKGGVGKSFTSRALAQFYHDSKQAFRAFDIDPVNPNLAQFYPNDTTQLDIGEPGALDEIRNAVEEQVLVLVDSLIDGRTGSGKTASAVVPISLRQSPKLMVLPYAVLNQESLEGLAATRRE
jgi:Mrp family chromosome partitioning ATPase